MVPLIVRKMNQMNNKRYTDRGYGLNYPAVKIFIPGNLWGKQVNACRRKKSTTCDADES